ncbi:MAG TPA: SpoIIE family protein phosphatase [Vicinamibacterales bacterium]|nr:SpoIIE family protein phosphatase [Vicinamibacterales bacterium]
MIVRLRVEPPGGDPFTHDLQGGETIIGRASTAGVVINDSSVSRQHARFVFRQDVWWIEDLGATNRTQLNGSTIEGATAIHPGDRLKMGGTVVHVLDDAASGATAEEPEPVSSIDSAGPRQAARLRTLNEIHRALATAISLPELLQLILDRSFDVLRPEEGIILLRTPSGQFEPAASRRLPSVKTAMVISRRLIDEVAGKSKPALVIDAAIDDRFSGSDSIMASGIRSVLAAPLVDATGTLGLIALCSRASVRRFSENDLELLVSLASAAALRVRNVALAEESAARKVFEHELSIAHDLQMSMLPRDLPARPEVALAARLQPARSVGGDLYDFVEDAGRLWFIVADVAGKSVAAALYMAVAKTLFRATIAGSASVADVVSRMNRELSRDNERLTFVTAIVGCLELASGRLAIVDAGHNPAVLLSPGGRMSTPDLTKCMALGVVEDCAYAETHLQLEPGTTLVLYTDGATDARNAAGEQFGSERLDRAFAFSSGLAPEALVNHVAATVERFEAGAPPEDDLTLLALQYRGKQGSS